MEYKGYTARMLALAAEAFRKELSAFTHGDDYWDLKKAVIKFKEDMEEGGNQNGS